jgi:hypothetical protein
MLVGRVAGQPLIIAFSFTGPSCSLMFCPLFSWKTVMTKVNKLGKGIILMHDFQKHTAEALPTLSEGRRLQGRAQGCLRRLYRERGEAA